MTDCIQNSSISDYEPTTSVTDISILIPLTKMASCLVYDAIHADLGHWPNANQKRIKVLLHQKAEMTRLGSFNKFINSGTCM